MKWLGKNWILLILIVVLLAAATWGVLFKEPKVEVRIVEVTKEVPVTKIVEKKVVVTATPTATLVLPTATPEPTRTEVPAPKALVEIAPIAEADIHHPYMVAYQDSLEYKVSSELRVPDDLLGGFTSVPSLVMTDTIYPNGYTVSIPPIPADLMPYQYFPHDDPANPNPIWGTPIASYREGDNWSCVDVSGWCADAVDSFNWIMRTGETVCHPAVGCITDPNGGAAMVFIVNFHDSDEAWDVRNNSGVYVTAGWSGFGMMFDLLGKSYDVGEGIAAIRNHYLYNLGLHEEYAGQCGNSQLCETVTYVIVARLWDRPELGIKFSHYELLDYGQWVRN